MVLLGWGRRTNFRDDLLVWKSLEGRDFDSSIFSFCVV